MKIKNNAKRRPTQKSKTKRWPPEKAFLLMYDLSRFNSGNF